MSMAHTRTAFAIVMEGKEIVEAFRARVLRGEIDAFSYGGFRAGNHQVDVKSYLFGPVRFLRLQSEAMP